MTLRSLAFALAAGGLLLAGCSSDPIVVVVSSQTSAPGTTQQALTESDFLELAHEIPYFAKGIDAGLGDSVVAVGKSICGIYEGNATETDEAVFAASVKLLITGDNVEAKDAGGFVTYSLAAFCPDQYPRLPSV